MAEVQRQVEAATAQVNSPELQQRIQEQVRQAERRMEEACRRLQEEHAGAPPAAVK